MLYHFYVGLDLGQAVDYTAIALLEEALWVPQSELEPPGWAWRLNLPEKAGWVPPASLTPRQAESVLAINFEQGRPPEPPLHVRHLERTQSRYPEVVERLGRLLASPALKRRRVALLADATGVGRGVVDLLDLRGLAPIPVVIHGGDSVTRDPDGRGLRVPKRDLISTTQVALQNGRLKVAAGLSLADTLKEELLNYRLKVNPQTAHDSYSAWREGQHDDLVLSVGMATWYRSWWNTHLDLGNARRAAMP